MLTPRPAGTIFHASQDSLPVGSPASQKGKVRMAGMPGVSMHRVAMRFTKTQQSRRAALLLALCLPLILPLCPGTSVARAQGNTSHLPDALRKSESLLIEFFKQVAAARLTPSAENVRRVRDTAARIREIAELLQRHPAAHKDSVDPAPPRKRAEALLEYLKMERPPDERDLFVYAEVDKPARVTYKPAPAFTVEAHQANVGRRVRLRVVLAADGAVKHIVPAEPLGNGITEEYIKAVRGVRFEPAMRKGRAVSQTALFEHYFN